MPKIKNILKFWTIAKRCCTYICNLKYSVPKLIPIVFYSGSNYCYHFTIKELAKEFEQFNCLK